MAIKNSKIGQILRLITAVLLALMVAFGLSGCLVKKKDLEKFVRTTDNLRVYQPGDTITYNVIATTVTLSGSSTQTGTLTLIWENPSSPLIRPDTSNPVDNVIKQTSSLNVGGVSNEGTVKYITQDGNGQITLHAFEASNTRYWLNSSSLSGATSTEPFVIFNSPLSPGPKPTIQYYILEGCEENSGICGDAVGSYEDNHDVVGDSWEVETNLGIFLNPFRIEFNGSATPLGGNSDLPITLDIRNICSTAQTDHGNTVGSGTMYVMPEIGIIRMENTCYEPITSTYTHYVITLRNTNFSLPW